jgi:exosortase A-associated hydrolase 2
MGAPLQAWFEPAAGRAGHRLYIYHPPAQGRACRGAVLYVHPFAEEMNKSRRMAALQAQRLARAGYAVLLPDLLGCGDSSGDFGDATWSEWVLDVADAARWLHTRHDAPLWLWGLRAGALLCAAAGPRLPQPPSFVFWQPATSGRQTLQQFLRLKAAGEMLDGGGKGVVESLRRQLADGQSVDVSGYRLHPQLASGLQAATLAPPPGGAARVEWLELQAQAGASLSPAALLALPAWQDRAASLRIRPVAGPAFWQTTEIETAPALLEATAEALEEPPVARAQPAPIA